MKLLLKIFPWFCLALFGTEIIAVLFPRKPAALHAADFGRLPVLLNGRVQPLDSVARNALLQMRSTRDVPLEQVPSWKFWHHPKKLKASDWLLEVLFKPDIADTRPIFLIHHSDLIGDLKLGDKGIERSGLRYYTFNEIQSMIPEINRQATQASDVEVARRTSYQRQVLKLANAVNLYRRLKSSIEPEGVSDLAALVQQYQAALPDGLAAFRARQAKEPFDQAALDRFSRPATLFDQVANMAYPLVIPPGNPEKEPNDWVNMGASLLGSIQTGDINPAVTHYARIATAYSQGDAPAFNKAVSEYTDWLKSKIPAAVEKGRAEFYYNQVQAFLHAVIIYIAAFVLAAGALLTFSAWPGVSESMRRAAFYLIALAFVVHTFGLIYRMALEGRPPVTNLYSSAIFIGWGACLLGLVLEKVYKVGLGCAVAGLAGFVTLLIAHNLALGGDTMEMLRAVLDTNFWLATHVVTVTIGYASTFVAGLLAIAYIFLGLFTPLLKQKFGAQPGAPTVKGNRPQAAGAMPADGGIELGKALTKMVYGIVCFATLFSFIGTVLGGIWADQSWGRFWGWDPKENGALLIVLWNALILHARWGGLVRERGLMNLAVFGNIVTSFSWFGVNLLGIGLHSYGFSDAGALWLYGIFMPSQVMIILLGCLPLSLWRSFQSGAAPATGKPSPRGSRPSARPAT